MKNKLLSINCSGESIEKVLTLIYYAANEYPDFYSNYAVELFYSHNLPKKCCSSPAHGTVLFYSTFFGNSSFLPDCTLDFFKDNKYSIINYLIYNNIISHRSSKLYYNDDLFESYITKLPFEYFYPTYIQSLAKIVQNDLGLYKIANLHLESNFYKIIETISAHSNIYKIYSLDSNGCIGTHSLYFDNVYQKIKTVNDLYKKSVLSGNAPLMLKQISDRISAKTIVGYRAHSATSRGTWKLGLQDFLNNRTCIEEPKITTFNQLYNDAPCSCSAEEKNDYVFSLGYAQLLSNYYKLIPHSAYNAPFLLFPNRPII